MGSPAAPQERTFGVGGQAAAGDGRPGPNLLLQNETGPGPLTGTSDMYVNVYMHVV